MDETEQVLSEWLRKRQRRRLMRAAVGRGETLDEHARCVDEYERGRSGARIFTQPGRPPIELRLMRPIEHLSAPQNGEAILLRDPRLRRGFLRSGLDR